MPKMEPTMPPQVDQEEPKVRRMYIQRKDIDKYGATAGCEGCRAAVRGGEARPHTEECRTRIEGEMAKAKDTKWERTNDKINSWMAKKIEEEDKKRRQTESNEAAECSKRESTEEEQENTVAKRRRHNEPQPSIAEEENRKRKPEGEVNEEDR